MESYRATSAIGSASLSNQAMLSARSSQPLQSPSTPPPGTTIGKATPVSPKSQFQSRGSSMESFYETPIMTSRGADLKPVMLSDSTAEPLGDASSVLNQLSFTPVVSDGPNPHTPREYFSSPADAHRVDDTARESQLEPSSTATKSAVAAASKQPSISVGCTATESATGSDIETAPRSAGTAEQAPRVPAEVAPKPAVLKAPVSRKDLDSAVESRRARIDTECTVERGREAFGPNLKPTVQAPVRKVGLPSEVTAEAMKQLLKRNEAVNI